MVVRNQVQSDQLSELGLKRSPLREKYNMYKACSNSRQRQNYWSHSSVNPSLAIMVFFNLSALLALTMAALAVAGPVGTVDAANKKWHCDEGVEGVDTVNCNWSREVVDAANKKWSCDEGVDAVNCNWT
ncbi:hypothetical protein MVEN_01287300 [Mycena venus]|uniref:Uncharacterized protein n=1 Tax=Mycena venus TaxID=2733690 RepID=A0A8H6XYE4_9AGAR|nr:hypothetical protein MVEN_01287300 [Mycena venus]